MDYISKTEKGQPFSSHALRYLSLGWSVIPLKPNSKEPLIPWKEFQLRRATPQEIKKWWERRPQANIGIVTGRISSLVVLDVDDTKKLEGIEIPQTPSVETSRGRHFYFSYPDSLGSRKVDGLEIKADGGYVVAPPSIHPFGKSYRWIHSPWEVELAELPESLLEIFAKRVGKETDSPLKGELKGLASVELDSLKESLKVAWVVGQRQKLALCMAGYMAKAGIHPLSVAKLFKMIAEERRDEELDQRFSGIYYTYKKVYGEERIKQELEELDRYALEQGVNPSKGVGVERGSVKGRSGLLPLLENVCGHEEALRIYHEISKILSIASPHEEDPILFFTDRAEGYLNDTKEKRIRKFRCKEEEGKRRIIKGRVVWACAIKNLQVLEDPLGCVSRYDVVVESAKGRPIHREDVSFEELYQILKSQGFLVCTQLGRDALASCVRGFVEGGKAIVKRERKPGFYIIDGQLRAVKCDTSTPSEEELLNAVGLIDQLIDAWYGEVRDRAVTVLKWGLISPFIFARKGPDRRYQVPYLALYGARNTGKTTLAEICTIHIWNLPQSRSGVGTQANTEARLGKILSTSTFPTLLNEANVMFDRRRVELINMLKHSVEGKYARGKYEGREYVKIPALSPLIFTLNPSPPVDFGGLELVPKTILLLHFSQGERLKRERIREFRREVEPKLGCLSALGRYTASEMLKRGVSFLMKEDWQSVAEEILQSAFKSLGVRVPEWIWERAEVEDFEEVEAEEAEEIRIALSNYINELSARMGVREGTIRERLWGLVGREAIPFMIKRGGKVYITTGILKELSLELESLKSLAELLGWQYSAKSIWMGGKIKRRSVIEVSLEELADFLGGELL